MKIFLLTHEKEIDRATNTGSIAITHSGDVVERIRWERVNPNKEILKLIDNNEVLLLYSKGDTAPSMINDYENIIIIDSTWQESQKIYNKSEYLKKIPHATLNMTGNSNYKLRRNQPEGGLCTIECIIEVLRIKGEKQLASKLEVEFFQFNDK
jgi:DTW domain-containing protein YfiP